MYPFLLWKEEVHPIVDYRTKPAQIDMSNYKFMKNQNEFDDLLQATIKNEYKNNWGISGYLENRVTLLENGVFSNRSYHLGIDIIVPYKTKLFAPLDGEIIISDYEEGLWNYGAFTVLKHQCSINYNDNHQQQTFYTFYGHLMKNSLLKVGTKVKKGECFACVGDYHENGNWFHHTHLQVFTEEGIKTMLTKGYCSESDLKNIKDLCPDPSFLLLQSSLFSK